MQSFDVGMTRPIQQNCARLEKHKNKDIHTTAAGDCWSAASGDRIARQNVGRNVKSLVENIEVSIVVTDHVGQYAVRVELHVLVDPTHKALVEALQIMNVSAHYRTFRWVLMTNKRRRRSVPRPSKNIRGKLVPTL